MRGCIKLSDGTVTWFTEDTFPDIVARLTDEQRDQLVALLRSRMGPRNPLPVDVDPEIYQMWYDDTHRKDVILGGGSGAESAKINKKGGKKYSVKDWHNKGDGDRNIVWLRNMGFKKKWDKNLGYRYVYGSVDLDLELIEQLDHESFKLKVREVMDNAP